MYKRTKFDVSIFNGSRDMAAFFFYSAELRLLNSCAQMLLLKLRFTCTSVFLRHVRVYLAKVPAQW